MWARALMVVASVLVAGPIVLSLFYDLPPLVFAVPPAVLYVAIWWLFRQLDAPRRPKPPPRRRRPPRPPQPLPHTPGARPRRKKRVPVTV